MDLQEQFRAALAFMATEAGRGFQARLSKDSKIPAPHINDVLHGRKGCSEETRRAIAASLGHTYEDMLSLGQWILEGKDPAEFKKIARGYGLVRKETPTPPPARLGLPGWDKNTEPGPDIIGMIPLISFVQAGGWADIVDNLQPGDADEWIPRTIGVGPRSFALRVSGTSMAPDYQPGDTIVVDPDCQPNNGSLVVARLNGDNEATFKRLVIDGGNTFLEPINQRYQPIDITGRDVTICGVVRQMVRNVQ